MYFIWHFVYWMRKMIGRRHNIPYTFTPPISGIYLSKTYPFPYCDLLDVANQIKWSMNSRIIVKWQGKYE